MRIEVAVENNYENKSIAWALDYPGCFAYGSDDAVALVNFPTAFIGYKERVQARAEKSWVNFNDIDIHVAETFDCHPFVDPGLPSATGKTVTAFWQTDWKPLSKTEIEQGLEWLKWSREDLVALTRSIPDKKLDREIPGEKWSIRGILNHIADSEIYFMDRLNIGAGHSTTLPIDTNLKLSATRNLFETTMHSLVGKHLVNGKDGSFWSPRKVLRRAAWHEVDHINHILRLLNEN